MMSVAEHPTRPVPRTSHPGLNLKNRTILIVADDHAKVRSLTAILRPEGYLVTAVNATEAASPDFLETEADLFLLDVELPGEHAYEICRRLKIRSGNTSTVIFIDSKSDPTEVVEGLAAGGVDYLPSPFRKQEILARIRVHLLNRLRLAHLNKADQAKNRLLCMAAHDLRNPLVSIRALVNHLRIGKADAVTPRQRDVLDTVYEASESMLDLVNELLDVSLLEAGELQLNPQLTSLGGLIAAAVRLSNATAAEKGSIIALPPGPPPPEISIDGPKIKQVLHNLLGNAIKFSPPGSTISVATELAPGLCAIMIRDRGPGIPESEHSRLFKDFSRTSVKPTGGESTTGLGLSICHAIMQAHAGAITTRNLPDGGAEFRITFPLSK